jgi:hypothetical protein
LNEKNSETGESYLSLEEGQVLVRLARRAINEYLKNRVTIEAPHTTNKLKEKSGVFVTLNTVKVKELRGCIGYPYPEAPLADAVIKAAIYAATEDPRFTPVTIREFQKSIVLELTVLTPPHTLQFNDRKDLPQLVQVGRHGLIIEGHGASGLLLPQIATDWKWTSDEFLSNCCMKAGLPPDYWLINGTTVKVFEGVIFEETYPAGEVRRRMQSE